jgi:hypothetical protein
METTFTRLECREILAHLDADCDPDVVAKLQQIAQSTKPLRPVNAIAWQETARLVEEANATTTFPFTFVRSEYQHLDDGEFEAYTRTFRMQWEKDQKRLREVAFESLAPTLVPAQYGSGIERIPLHQKNGRGDTCISVDPDSGFSTFACAKCGNTYVANNPAVRGCICGGSGDSASLAEADDAAPTVREDPGAIPGHDSAW